MAAIGNRRSARGLEIGQSARGLEIEATGEGSLRARKRLGAAGVEGLLGGDREPIDRLCSGPADPARRRSGLARPFAGIGPQTARARTDVAPEEILSTPASSAAFPLCSAPFVVQ